MTEPYRIFGSELSPYSVKVRNYCRYKAIEHEWIVRNPSNLAEFQEHAKLPLIPLVLTPEGEAWQDSTPIIEKLEARFPEPALEPEDAALAFLSALIEEFADEWGNKAMFHYRWAYAADQLATAGRIALTALGVEGKALPGAAAKVRERMIGRLSFVGSSPQTARQIEGAFLRLLAILEAHLAGRDYLFGGRPALGDFGLWAQLYQSSTDPTPGAIMRDTAPQTLAWIERMRAPEASGDFEPWPALAETLSPLLREQVGALFLPWSQANAKALADGAEDFTVELAGEAFSQQPQKYHARSLGVLKAKYLAIADRGPLDEILGAVDCLAIAT